MTGTTTKRDIVDMAFEELTLAGYEFDATPEERFSALRRLDILMASKPFSALDYNQPATIGLGILEDFSWIPDEHVQVVAITLALRVAPTIGKTMSAESKLVLATGMSALRAATAVIPDRVMPGGVPRGSGAKPATTWTPFTFPETAVDDEPSDLGDLYIGP